MSGEAARRSAAASVATIIYGWLKYFCSMSTCAVLIPACWSCTACVTYLEPGQIDLWLGYIGTRVSTLLADAL